MSARWFGALTPDRAGSDAAKSLASANPLISPLSPRRRRFPSGARQSARDDGRTPDLNVLDGDVGKRLTRVLPAYLTLTRRAGSPSLRNQKAIGSWSGLNGLDWLRGLDLLKNVPNGR
jgi:hypothetical protein